MGTPEIPVNHESEFIYIDIPISNISEKYLEWLLLAGDVWSFGFMKKNQFGDSGNLTLVNLFCVSQSVLQRFKPFLTHTSQYLGLNHKQNHIFQFIALGMYLLMWLPYLNNCLDSKQSFIWCSAKILPSLTTI